MFVFAVLSVCLCSVHLFCLFVPSVEELTNALEDERELVKAVKKKNSNIIKDLQKQLQSSNRFVGTKKMIAAKGMLILRVNDCGRNESGRKNKVWSM